MENFPLKTETYQIIGICMEVHRILGHGFLEIVYKDAIEYEVRQKSISYFREKEYLIDYKKAILPHRFYADFVLFDNIILEIKAAEAGISDVFTAQILNYLRASGCKIGIIANFGKSSLEYKRLIL
jgi:GxxExxY protein